MKTFLLVSTTIFMAFAARAQTFQTADIGFHSSDDYIATDISPEEKNPNYAFSLCSTSLATCVPMSPCKYKEDDIQRRLDAVQDQEVKDNFLNHRDGFAAGNIEQVYPHIQAMLESIAPSCPVDNLQKIRGRLHPSHG